MDKRIFTTVTILGVCLTMSACAQFKKTSKKKAVRNEYAVHIESVSQRTLPGRQETPPATEIYHVLLWNSKEIPHNFFWKDGDTWVSLKTYTAHSSRKKLNGATEYTKTPVRVEKIKKGDTVLLTMNPPADKTIVPKEIPDTATSTIFYKTFGGSKWIPIPVRAYRKLPDIVMP